MAAAFARDRGGERVAGVLAPLENGVVEVEVGDEGE